MDGDVAAVGFDNAPDDRQPDAGPYPRLVGVVATAGGTRGLPTEAEVEQAGQVGGGDPAAPVGDREYRPVGVRSGGDLHRPVVGGVPDGVDEEVGEHPPHLGHVGVDVYGVVGAAGDGHPSGACHRVGGGDRVRHDVGETHLLQRQLERAGLQPGQFEQVIDHAGQPLGVGEHQPVVTGRRLGVRHKAVLQGLRRRPDSRQRGTQVMADPGHQLTPAGFQRALAVPRRHEAHMRGVQGAGQCGELGRWDPARIMIFQLTEGGGCSGECSGGGDNRPPQPYRSGGGDHCRDRDHDQHDPQIVVGQEHGPCGAGNAHRHRDHRYDRQRRRRGPQRPSP